MINFANVYLWDLHMASLSEDASGRITTVFATYDPQSKSGTEGGNRKTKATINWVECNSALDAEVRLYDRLFAVENPSADERDFRELLNPDSLIVTTAKIEPALANVKPQDHFQVLKQGYFVVDDDSTPGHLIFNRTASLKDNWQK